MGAALVFTAASPGSVAGEASADTVPIVVETAGPRDLSRAIDGAGGKVVVANFWATWCEPCREEFPDLVRFARERAGVVRLITVSLDFPEEANGSVREFLTRMKAPGPAFIKAEGDPDEFINSIDPEWSGSLPATFIYGPDGSRRHAIHGTITYEKLEELVEPLLPSG